MSRSETTRLNEDNRQTLEMLSVVLSAAVSHAAEFEARRGQARGAGPVPDALRGRLDRDPASRPRRPGRRGEPRARADARLHRRGVRRDDHARLHPPRGLPARRGAASATLMLGEREAFQARGALLAEGRRARLGSGERRARARSGRRAGLRGDDDREHHGAQARRGGARPPGRAERAPGAARSAHRPAEPAALRDRIEQAISQAERGRHAPRDRDDGSRPLQGGQRLARAPGRRRAARGGRRAAAAARCARRTPSRGSAATSSACCCPQLAARTTACSRRSSGSAPPLEQPILVQEPAARDRGVDRRSRSSPITARLGTAADPARRRRDVQRQARERAVLPSTTIGLDECDDSTA